MPNSDDITPVQSESALNRFYKANQAWLDRLLIIVITAIAGTVFHVKLSDIEAKTDTASVKADTAATKADTAAKVSQDVQGAVLKTEVAASKLVANSIGAPEDKKALVEAKTALEQHQAATQEAK